jgi:hypothetical protein
MEKEKEEEERRNGSIKLKKRKIYHTQEVTKKIFGKKECINFT